MYEYALPAVLRKYGLTKYLVSDHQKGYRNEIWPVQLADGSTINVTFYKREPGMAERIVRADAVSEYLAVRGMPTRQRLDPRMLQLKNNHGVTNVGVYTYLPGTAIPWESYTMTHIKLLGQTQSNMHALLANASITDLPPVYDEYQAIITRMERYFAELPVRAAMRQKLGLQLSVADFDRFRHILSKCQRLPGQQVLHMDFVRGNILFDVATPSHTQQLDGLAISGVLDFEKTAFGHPVLDIARTLAFLLVDCKYKAPAKVSKYFLVSGYQKRGVSKDMGDVRARNHLVELFLLYDFYKFLRHNPYESLQANEHYLRTKDILSRRGMIR